MNRVADIDIMLNQIRARAHYYGVSPHLIATATGMSPGALRDMGKEDWNPKASTIRLIEEYLDSVQKNLRKKASR